MLKNIQRVLGFSSTLSKIGRTVEICANALETVNGGLEQIWSNDKQTKKELKQDA